MFYAHGHDKGALKSRIELWMDIYKKSGKVKSELNERPSLRPEAIYLWNIYCEIITGCEKVTFAELDAWSRLTGKRLESWEIELMIKLDQVRCEHGR